MYQKVEVDCYLGPMKFSSSTLLKVLAYLPSIPYQIFEASYEEKRKDAEFFFERKRRYSWHENDASKLLTRRGKAVTHVACEKQGDYEMRFAKDDIFNPTSIWNKTSIQAACRQNERLATIRNKNRA